MKLFTVFWIYDEHEMENEVFASETGSEEDARKYLIATQDMEDDLLYEVSVHPFTTVNSSNGDPYKVVLA